MIKRRFILLFFGLVFLSGFFYKPVYAYLKLATATPTHDVRTPPSTPNFLTPYNFVSTSEYDWVCPAVGTMPVNYGSVTPSSLWNMACGRCLPSATPWGDYAFPTSVLDASATPVTGTPSFTPTITPTFAMQCGTNPTITSTVTLTPVNTVTPSSTPTVSYTSVVVDDAAFTNTGVMVIDNGAAGAYLNSLTRTTSEASGSSSYTFTGTGFSVYSRVAFNRGLMSVTVDGNFLGNADLYSSSTVDTALVYSYFGLAHASHTVVFAWTGSKNASSSATLVNIDKFVYVYGGTTPTPINTLTPSSTVTPLGFNNTFHIVSKNFTKTGSTVMGGNSVACFPVSGEHQAFECYGNVDGTDNSTILGGSIYFSLVFKNTINGLAYTDYYYYATHGTMQSGGTPFCQAPGGVLKCQGVMHIQNSGNGALNIGVTSSSGYRGPMFGTFYVYISVLPAGCAVAPPGTATPDPGMTWCNIISDSPTQGGINDILFWGATGNQTCGVVPSLDTSQGWWGALISTVLSWFGVGDLVTPAFTYCLVEYDWLDINILSVVFNLAFLFDAVVVVAILRRLMGSGST